MGFQSAYTLALSAVVLGLLAFVLFIRSKLPSSWNRPKVVKRKGNFELMGIPHVRNVLIASSFMSMAWDLQSFMIPVYGTEIGLSASEVGWILGVFAAATFFVRLFMPIIARHLTEWQTITCAFALGAASYALFPIFNNFYMLSAVAFLLGMALGSSQPNVMSLIHTESPPGRTGEALGLRTMLINLCHTTLPIIFGGAGNLIGAAQSFTLWQASWAVCPFSPPVVRNNPSAVPLVVWLKNWSRNVAKKRSTNRIIQSSIASSKSIFSSKTYGQ